MKTPNALVILLFSDMSYIPCSAQMSPTVTIISDNVKKEDSPLNHLDGRQDSATTINQENNRLNNKEINYGNEFRRVQEAVRKGDSNTVGKGGIPINARQRLGAVLRRELESQSSFSSQSQRVRVLTYTGREGNASTFSIHSEVNPQLFHDIFEVVRFYTENAELVDLHDDYSNCRCYLNEDGTCGFAIEPDGNLVSVFNLGVQKGFLPAIKDFVIEQGATHLDAYNSDKQPLREIHEKVLGVKVASSMDYNMEYDHDDIAKNHGNPQVVFMVLGEAAKGEVVEKHFNKDQYDEAEKYQKSFLEIIPSPQTSEVWQKAASIQEPKGRRPVQYTSPGQPTRTYYVEDGHIYNNRGQKVFAIPQVRTHKNKILFKLAYNEGRAVIINHKGNRYIVDNHQNILSVHTGEVMQWGEENGDRRNILLLAEDAFRQKQEEAAQQPVHQQGKTIGQQDSPKPFETEIFGEKAKVNSLEQAMALHKLYEMYDEIEGPLIKSEQMFNALKEQILSASPEEVSKINIPMSAAVRKRWYENKDTVLETLRGEMANAPQQPPQKAKPKSADFVSQEAEDTTEALRNWLRYSNAHIRFDRKKHKYYVDDKPADFSVSEYIESIFGKPDIEGDYSHSQAIGNTMDALYRDYFDPRKNVNTLQYPNLNEQRKQQAIKDIQRFEAYLDKRFGVKDGVRQYKVITTEFPIAARFDTPQGMKTIAGTMDMLVIDKEGNVHIFDFKAKNHPITQTYYGKEVSDRRDYTAQQNLYRAILEANPAFKGKVKDIQLVWMDTAYPKLREARYQTDKESNEVTVVGDVTGKVSNMPLSEYDKFKTPSLKPNVEDSIIPLTVTDDIENLHIPELHAMDFITRQVIDHLKAMGIPVHGREDLIKWIKEHGYSSIKQAFDDIQMMAETKANIFDEKFAENKGDVVSLQQANMFLDNLAQQLESGKKLDDTTIEIFNEIINRVQNGEIRIKGINPETLRGNKNKTLSVLTVLSRFGRERYRTSGRSGQVEKTVNLVRKYFQGIDKWNENIDQTIKNIYGEPSKESGIESLIFFSGDDVIKLQSLSTAKLDLARAIERIFLQNEFDSTCQTEIIGVGQTQHGEFRLLLRQPHIKEAVQASPAEIKADMEKKGFEYVGEGGYGPIYKNSKTEETVEDVRPRNVLKTKDGILHYIDVIPSKNEQSVTSEIEETPFLILKLPYGKKVKVYGLVDRRTMEMYLDDAVINPDTPIHEYTHIWDKVISETNKDLWKQGVSLMKQLKLWKEIEENPNYGLKWKDKGNTSHLLMQACHSDTPRHLDATR